ncbi:hypothetical protein DdX_19549 [Ditylenchus destructor]|uniref:Uncharacterized protein n=1 Tax=Ditylenchus destructor TaxID=166010 RepID=A0AAD4MHJ9_9BILA|nr:hypothetical protein DdX_19549 [Ditylenchus destructor]
MASNVDALLLKWTVVAAVPITVIAHLTPSTIDRQELFGSPWFEFCLLGLKIMGKDVFCSKSWMVQYCFFTLHNHFTLKTNVIHFVIR